MFYNNDSANYSGNNKANPLLKNLLENKYTVWEAISAINSWVSKSMKFTSDNERPVQPVRIYRKHIGRCGEYQDMRCAAGRAALIPTACTLNSAEDHVWNEFCDQRWIHWDGGCHNPMKYENGWGKKISSVWNFRGDSHIWSVTSKYTQTCTYTATVLDSAGLPVDGVEVWAVTRNYYDPNQLTITTWGATDYNGKFIFELGDSRDYLSCADAEKLGEAPPDSGGNDQVTQIVTGSTTGGQYAHTFNLPNSAPSLKIKTGSLPANPLNRFKMDVSYEVESNILQGVNVYTGEHSDYMTQGGNIDFFIANSTNFNDYKDGESFDAFDYGQRGDIGDTSFVIPTDDEWYAVLSNEFSQRTTKIVNITVDIYGSLFAEIKAPVQDSELSLDSIIEINGSTFSPLDVSSVEIDIDNKDSWQSTVDTSGSGRGYSAAWCSWKFDWNTLGLTPGKHNIRLRAADSKNTVIESLHVILIQETERYKISRQLVN